jgi:hypothetical protein
MFNTISQAVAGTRNDVPQDSRAERVQIAPAPGSGRSTGSQHWSRARLSVATAGRTFGHHNPMARAYSDVSTQL